MAVRDQIMSSTERAPEPTMEEILASIRRIIAEDESNSARQQRSAPVAQQDEEGLEAAEGEADNGIISDIARVLSESGKTPEEAEEDILDLTSELGGMEIVEEQVMIEEVVAESLPAPEVFQPALVTSEPEAEAALEAQAQAPELTPAPPSMSASEEAASALERAIAALRAGQLPTSFSEFTSAPQSAPQAEAPTYAVPVFSTPEPQPEPTWQSEPELQPEAEPEPELLLSEFEAEAIVEEPAAPEAVAENEAEASSQTWESETAPWSGASEPLIEPERAAIPLTNGHSAEPASGGSHKSLEDSVKDMLRPMLKQWLDENMTRVLTAALKDEIRDNPARFQRD
jgi:hypothetical protein